MPAFLPSVRYGRAAIAVFLAIASTAPLVQQASSAHALQKPPVREGFIELLKVSQDIDDALSWFFWAIDAMGAMRAGETPPAAPAPFPASKLEDTLRGNLDAVRRFEGPSFVRPLPANAAVPTTSHEARIHLRAQIELLLGATDEMADSQQHAPMLLELRTRCRTAQRVLQSVTQVLEKLLAAGIDPTGQVTYQWFNQVTVYQPLLVAIEQAATDKAASITKVIQGRAGAVRAAATGLQAALAVEAAALAGEAQRLEATNQELRERLAALDLEEARLRELNQRIVGLGRALEDLKSVARTLAADQSMTEQRITGLRNRIQSLDTAINQPYTSCPNKQNYATCNHTSLKQQYDSAKTQNQNQRNQATTELQAEQRRLAEVKASLTTNMRSQQDTTADLDTRRRQYQIARQAQEDARATYEQDFLAALWDMWRSRANVYASENRRDIAAVAAAVKGLP